MIDPFAQARQDLVSGQNVYAGDPFSTNQAAQATQVPVGGPIQVSSGSPIMKGFENMMIKAGIDPSGIDLSDKGKGLLLDRIQKKFGPNYMQTPDALDLISAFDKGFPKFDNQIVSSTQRTLKALLGG